MYAVVDINGQQFKVSGGDELFVHRLPGEPNAVQEFDKVLLVEKDGKTQIGTPFLEGVRVSAKVLQHMKGDKVIVFKKKRRKGYQKMNGHRQYFSKIKVQAILGKGESFKEETKAATPKKAPKKVTKTENTGE